MLEARRVIEFAEALLAAAGDGARHVGAAAHHLVEEPPGRPPDRQLEGHVAAQPQQLLRVRHPAHAVRRPHDAVDHPGLAPDLARPPAHPDRQVGQEGPGHRGAQEPAVARDGLDRQPAAEPQDRTPQRQAEHGEADAHHDAKTVEWDRHVGPVRHRERVQALDLAVPTVRLEQAQDVRDGDGPGVAVVLLVRPGEDVPARVDAAVRVVGLVVALHGGQHGRLVLGHGQPHAVAEVDLHGGDGHQHQHGELEGLLEGRHVPLLVQVVGRHADHEGQPQLDAGDEHVRETVDHVRVEQSGPPVLHGEDAIVHGHAGRGLHPRVRDEDPHRREGRRQGHVEGGEEVHALGDLAPAEDHQADEARLVHEGRDGLVAQDLPEEGTDGLRERPVQNAERHLHCDAGGDAGREIDDQQLLKEATQAVPVIVVAADPAEFREEQQDREADRQGRVQDVQRGDPAEIEPGQEDWPLIFFQKSLQFQSNGRAGRPDRSLRHYPNWELCGRDPRLPGWSFCPGSRRIRDPGRPCVALTGRSRWPDRRATMTSPRPRALSAARGRRHPRQPSRARGL